MNTTQKIKKLIILVIIVSVLTISCIFYQNFNIFINNFLDKQNIITLNKNLLVHFISIGQGDAIAMNLPSGEILLIDTGRENKNVDYINYLNNKVIGNKDSQTIDYLILTHADADHIGGTLKLLDEFKVENIFLPSVESDTKIYTEIKNTIEGKYIDSIVQENLNINIEGLDICVYNLPEAEDKNDSSPLIKLVFKNSSFLFTGDLSIDAEKYILKNCPFDLNSDVLKVAHHGSSESTSEEFLMAVTPEYSVISVGENSYGHPHEEVVKRLENIDSKILRTDIDGNVLFVVGEKYGMSYFSGNFYVTDIICDYRLIVLIIDALIFVNIAIIVFKKTKDK